MAILEINLKIDSDNANEMSAARMLLNVLSREKGSMPAAEEKEEVKPSKPPVDVPTKSAKQLLAEMQAEEAEDEKPTRTKKETAPEMLAKAAKAEKDKARRDKKRLEEAAAAEAEESAEEEGDEEEAAEESDDDEGEVTLEKLRTLLSAKVGPVNKDAISKKLAKFGATRLGDLDPKKYQSMYDFLEDLD